MGLQTCSDNHNKIIYDEFEHNGCPLCSLRIEMDEVLDAKTEIDEADIFDLYDLNKSLERRVKRIERRLSITKRWWQRSNKVGRTSAEQTPREATF